MTGKEICSVPTETMVANILAVFHSANENERTEGVNWYVKGHETCAELAGWYCMDVDTVASVVSALSPSNRWRQNVVDAETVLDAHIMGQDPGGVTVFTYNGNKRKAFGILDGQYGRDPFSAFGPRAPKTSAFARLLAGQRGPVCVDGHATNIALHGMRRRGITTSPRVEGAAYEHIATAYRAAAGSVGIRPEQMQAVTWIAYRNMNQTEV